MTQASRLRTTACALGDALDALADALTRARVETVANDMAARVRDFQAAAAGLGPDVDDATAFEVARVAEALARCRRLGASLTLLTRPYVPADLPNGYGAIGQLLPPSGEGTSVTARV